MANQNQGSQGQGSQNQGSQNQGSQGASSQNQQGASGQQQGSQQQGSEQYWKKQFQNEPYYQQGKQFEDYQSAYQAGEQGRQQYGSGGESFSQSEKQLRSEYENSTKGNQKALKWEEGAGKAAEAAWNRAGSQSSDRDMQQGSQASSQQQDRGENTGRKS